MKIRCLAAAWWLSVVSLLLWILPAASGFLVGNNVQVANPPPTSSLTKRIRTNKSLVVVYQSDKPYPYFVSGPDADTKPDYENIHGPMGKMVDDVLLSMFRTRLAEQVGVDSDKPKVRDTRCFVKFF